MNLKETRKDFSSGPLDDSRKSSWKSHTEKICLWQTFRMGAQHDLFLFHVSRVPGSGMGRRTKSTPLRACAFIVTGTTPDGNRYHPVYPILPAPIPAVKQSWFFGRSARWKGFSRFFLVKCRKLSYTMYRKSHFLMHNKVMTSWQCAEALFLN